MSEVPRPGQDGFIIMPNGLAVPRDLAAQTPDTRPTPSNVPISEQNPNTPSTPADSYSGFVVADEAHHVWPLHATHDHPKTTREMAEETAFKMPPEITKPSTGSGKTVRSGLDDLVFVRHGASDLHEQPGFTGNLRGDEGKGTHYHPSHVDAIRNEIARSALARPLIVPRHAGKIEHLHPRIMSDDMMPLVRPQLVDDGAEFIKDKFGGFGPGSPEHDNEKRLSIVIPNSKRAVEWFSKDAEADDPMMNMLGGMMGMGHNQRESQSFDVKLNEEQHPGVASIGVRFTKSTQIAYIEGEVSLHHDWHKPKDTPSQTSEGHTIDTSKSVRPLFIEHLQSRLDELFPGKTTHPEAGRGQTSLVSISDTLNIEVNYSAPQTLRVMAAKTRGTQTNERPSSDQLETELLAIQEHFPSIAEATAEFFRAQLPKTEIRIAPKRKKNKNDVVNPGREANLREAMLIEPREDDFKYIGGLDQDIARLMQASVGFENPEAFAEFGVEPPRGILLMGPPGVGKTSLVNGFANNINAVMLKVKASTIKSGLHGETEKNAASIFDIADDLVDEGKTVVLFFDEIESLVPNRNGLGSGGIEASVTTEILQGLNVDRKNCIIIAATNAPDKMDPALTQNSSRFTEKLEIGYPDEAGRADIFSKLLQKFVDKSAGGTYEGIFTGIELETLAKDTDGLNGADIENAIQRILIHKAVMLAQTGEKHPVTHGELYRSIKEVQIGKQAARKNHL